MTLTDAYSTDYYETSYPGLIMKVNHIINTFILLNGPLTCSVNIVHAPLLAPSGALKMAPSRYPTIHPIQSTYDTVSDVVEKVHFPAKF